MIKLWRRLCDFRPFREELLAKPTNSHKDAGLVKNWIKSGRSGRKIRDEQGNYLAFLRDEIRNSLNKVQEKIFQEFNYRL